MSKDFHHNSPLKKSIAIIATGNEMTTGQVVNTNASTLASDLDSRGLIVSTHVCINDDKYAISQAIDWLRQDHELIIIIGGLGPTTDDVTREAVAQALDLDLIFNPSVWQTIKEAYHAKNMDCPDANRRQAFVLDGARVLPVPKTSNGSAPGFWVSQNDCHFFALPGPPHECLTMYHQMALPLIQKLKLQTQPPKQTWLLFQASEAMMTEQLEFLATKSHIQLGYRAFYPYLEIKAWSTTPSDFQLIEDALGPWLTHEQETYSQALLRSLDKQSSVTRLLLIGDLAALKWLAPQVFHQKVIIHNHPKEQWDFQIDLSQPNTLRFSQGLDQMCSSFPIKAHSKQHQDALTKELIARAWLESMQSSQ